MEDKELINEFLVESYENINRLDQDFVALEQAPKDQKLLSSIFRTIHTIKGTCGFLNFFKLESITHLAENILGQLRNGKRELTTGTVSVLLETVDAVKRLLRLIEATGEEGNEDFEPLKAKLRQVAEQKAEAGAEKAAEKSAPPAAEAVPAPPEVTGLSTAASLAAPPEAESPGQDGVENHRAPEKHAAPEKQAVPEKHAALETSPAAREPAGLPGELRSAEPRSTEPPREEAAPPATGDAAARVTVADSTIRVDVALLDKLMNLVGELVLARNQVLQFTGLREDASFSATSQRLNLITTELQAGVMKTRMQPIGNVWNKLPRVVRDLASACGKQVTLEMEGADTELDKTIIEAIRDPLTHIVRNSVDHGIEMPGARTAKGKPAAGRLFLRAYHEGGQVNIEISDDGGGIGLERVKRKAIHNGLITTEQAERLSERELLRLIFLPGFSTAEKVTAVSGRGVGMDVVKTNIEKIGGTLDLDSHADKGTTIKIKIPLTLAIIPALVVTSAGERFAIPQVSLLELVRLEGESARSIERVHGTPVYRLRGNLLPIVYLNQILDASPAKESDGPAKRGAVNKDGVVNIVVLQADDRQFGLVVDRVNDTEEIVVKPLGKQLKGISTFAGATIMGDGRVALILDVLGLAQKARIVTERREQAVLEEQDGGQRPDRAGERQTFLLFQAGTGDRLCVPLSLVARLEEFPLAQVEHASGQAVMQYRGQILPLVRLASVLGVPEPPERDPVQVIVFSDGEKRIGIVVGAIIDIVDESVAVTRESGRRGIAGSAVIAQRVTDLLDLHTVISEADPHWFRSGGEPAKEPRAEAGRRVLLVDDSPFLRCMLRTELEMAGYRVVEAADGFEALEKLAGQSVQAVLTDLSMPGMDGFELARRIQMEERLAGVPVIGIASSSAEGKIVSEQTPFAGVQMRFDHQGMIEALERLASSVTAASEGAREGEERSLIHA